MLNLDTHILLYVIPGRLTARERKIAEADREWGISAIVLWEIEMLHQHRRIPHGLDDPLLKSLLSRIEILPLSREVCLKLRALDFKSDPADQIIAATSLAYKIPLLTRDARIRTSKVVRCL